MISQQIYRLLRFAGLSNQVAIIRCCSVHRIVINASCRRHGIKHCTSFVDTCVTIPAAPTRARADRKRFGPLMAPRRTCGPFMAQGDHLWRATSGPPDQFRPRTIHCETVHSHHTILNRSTISYCIHNTNQWTANCRTILLPHLLCSVIPDTNNNSLYMDRYE